jgi:hypothetical protein
MPNVALTEFLPAVLRGVPNAARPVALEAVRRAVNQVLIKSEIWQYTLTPMALVAGQSEYTLVPPTNTYAVNVMDRIWVDDYYFDPTSREALFRKSVTWETDTADKLYGAYLSGLNVLRVAPTPTVAAAGDLMTVRVALALKPAATEVLEDLYQYDECRYAVEHLARRDLFTEPNTDWFSPEQAKFDSLEANRYMTQVLTRTTKNRTNRDLHVQMVSFGR